MGVIGVVVGALFWDEWISVIGWVVAGPLAIGVIAWFTTRDTARQAAPLYVRPDWLTLGYVGALLLIAAGIVVSTVGFALWMGRQ